MSVRVMSRVWDDFPGGGSQLLALLALADWSDDDGRCYPSIAAIAKKARLSRSQAQRLVHSLINQGFVAVTGNQDGGAPGYTRKYKINLERLTNREDATPTGSANATGRTHAQDGSHPCGSTGRMGATQTVIETSFNRQERKQRREPQFMLPEWIPGELFDTWQSAQKKRATVAQKDLAVKKLTEWRDQGLDWLGALEKAAMGGWTTLYKPDPPKPSLVKRNGAPGSGNSAANSILGRRKPPEVINV